MTLKLTAVTPRSKQDDDDDIKLFPMKKTLKSFKVEIAKKKI